MSDLSSSLNESRRRSASAIQLEERKARMSEMAELASRITEGQVRQILAENPSISDDELIAKVKGLGIPIQQFIYSYIRQIGVSEKVAKSYFNCLSQKQYPNFILNDDKTHFHVNIIDLIVADVRENASH